MNVQTPLPTKGLTAVLAVDFLVNSFLPLMDGSNVFCHMALSREHLITVRTWYALNSAVFGLSHVDVSNVGAQVGLGGEYPDTHVTPLVAGVVCQARHLAGELLLLLYADGLQDGVHV